MVCENLLTEIDAWCQRYDDCNVILTGDFNVDLDSADNVARFVSAISQRYSLLCYDKLFLIEYRPTYVNFALNQQSRIDYILASPGCNVSNFFVIGSDINFSDHLPLFAVIECAIPFKNTNNSVKPSKSQEQLRWDKADLVSFYQYSCVLSKPVTNKTRYCIITLLFQIMISLTSLKIRNCFCPNLVCRKLCPKT